MPSVEGSGLQVCTLATEHTLFNSALSRSFVLVLDMSPALSGDVFVVRLKRKVRTSSTLREVLRYEIEGGDIVEGAEPIFQSIPVVSPGFQFVATLQQSAGSAGRSIEYSVESV